jgi:hypothetical protein
MDKYVTAVKLVVNGEEITDFSSITEKDYELRRPVKLMNKTGVAGVTPQYGLEVDYTVPLNAPEFDFDSVEDATLIIEYPNDEMTTYTGVCTLKVGATKYDGEKEATRTIELFATGRN